MFLFNLFKKKPKLVNKVSKGCDIILSETLYNRLENLHYNLSVSCKNGKPNCVQLTTYKKGKNIYVSSLKKFLGVKSFKNGNICDYSPDNLVYYK